MGETEQIVEHLRDTITSLEQVLMIPEIPVSWRDAFPYGTDDKIKELLNI